MSRLIMLGEGYSCPFCPSHLDGEFVWHELAETYICLGCQAEIDCGFDFEQQPTFDEYSCADTIERLLKHLGISYVEAKKQHEKNMQLNASSDRYIFIRV